ncbi:MAG: toll/interleukin-1 receptor domain-containing protein, partial [Desulfobacterales bacterium]|nr:toll/interleukin-1 receptor domain-containing protein [Desulfobacterales bacterium]
MSKTHFISYSAIDGEDFTLKLYDALLAGPPEIPVWMDKRDIEAARNWDEEIVEAIRSCGSLLFVITRDSVSRQSTCKQEWSRAMKYKKPVIPLLLHADAEIPFRLETRQFIDFTRPFEGAMAKLRLRLQKLDSPRGKLHDLEERLGDAQRELRRPDNPMRARVLDDMAHLEDQIRRQQRLIDDPDGEARRTRISIERAIERERLPERPVGGVAKTRFINPPPGTVPAYFQNRYAEIKLIGDFIKEDAARMITVVGRAGIGKTAMVCKLLKSLENGELPDDGGP